MAASLHMCARFSRNQAKNILKFLQIASNETHIQRLRSIHTVKKPNIRLISCCNGFFRVESETRKVAHIQNTMTRHGLLSSTIRSLYSTSTQESTVDNLTQGLLKSEMSKHGHTGKESENGKQESESGNKEKKSEEKKGRFANWTGKNVWKLGLVLLTGWCGITSSLLVFVWGAPLTDRDGKLVEDEFSHLPKVEQYMKRSWREAVLWKQMIREPSSKKLLPDPLTEPYYQPPYTLVLEMTGVLVHPDWSYGTGWRFKKRPGIDYFLQQIGPPLYEVVVYTHEQGFTALPIINTLDPQGYIMYKLFRDSTSYVGGTHVKDLDCLNRDLSKVIIVDCNPNAYKLHKRNAVGLKKWNGNDEDRDLFDLASFLRMIAVSGVQDVRTVLENYNKFDDPMDAFRQRQRQLQEEEQRKQEMVAAQEQKPLASRWGSGVFGRR